MAKFKQANKNINAVVVVLLLFAVGAAGILYNYYAPSLSRVLPHTNTVVLPVINTYVSSGGASHPVEAIVALEFTEYVLNVDKNMLAILVEDAVSNLDYDSLQEPGSISYVQDALRDSLKSAVPDDEIVGVYVTELQCGDYTIAVPPGQPGLDGRSNSAKNLFQGIQQK